MTITSYETTRAPLSSSDSPGDASSARARANRARLPVHHDGNVALPRPTFPVKPRQLAPNASDDVANHRRARAECCVGCVWRGWLSPRLGARSPPGADRARERLLGRGRERSQLSPPCSKLRCSASRRSLGKRVHAAVVLREAGAASEDELVEHCPGWSQRVAHEAHFEMPDTG
jgi:hypothetical protein